MEAGAQLSENSLAIPGETIEEGTVWQGIPASWWFSYTSQESSVIEMGKSFSVGSSVWALRNETIGYFNPLTCNIMVTSKPCDSSNRRSLSFNAAPKQPRKRTKEIMHAASYT
jgi:hypothetical protein